MFTYMVLNVMKWFNRIMVMLIAYDNLCLNKLRITIKLYLLSYLRINPYFMNVICSFEIECMTYREVSDFRLLLL